MGLWIRNHRLRVFRHIASAAFTRKAGTRHVICPPRNGPKSTSPAPTRSIPTPPSPSGRDGSKVSPRRVLLCQTSEPFRIRYAGTFDRFHRTWAVHGEEDVRTAALQEGLNPGILKGCGRSVATRLRCIVAASKKAALTDAIATLRRNELRDGRRNVDDTVSQIFQAAYVSQRIFLLWNSHLCEGANLAGAAKADGVGHSVSVL